MISGIIVVDKPIDITSHGVVSRLRRILKERRIGHGGTLDPMATGVLPIFIGRATRASSLLLSSDKSYRATIKLGITTDTQDITGHILSTSTELPSKGEFINLLPSFVGKQLQRPPMYSAIKVGGKKLYEIARSGGSVDVPLREITIYSISDPVQHSPDEYIFDVKCSKGTYIRTLIHDIGSALGCGATLSGLRRTSTGPFDLSSAHTIENIALAAESGNLNDILIDVDFLFNELPEIEINEYGEKLCRDGAIIPVDISALNLQGCPEHEPNLRVYGPNHSFLMIASLVKIADGYALKTVKNFFEIG